MTEVRRIGLFEVVRHFEELEDPRSEVNLRHPSMSVVVIGLLAVLASGPTAIARWAVLKQEFLLPMLDLPNGYPVQGCLPPCPQGLETGRLPGLLRRLAAVVEPRSDRGDRCGATHPGDGRQDGTAEPRSPERPGHLAFGQRLGQRVRPLAGSGGVRREIERDHGHPGAAEASPKTSVIRSSAYVHTK